MPNPQTTKAAKVLKGYEIIASIQRRKGGGDRFTIELSCDSEKELFDLQDKLVKLRDGK